mgnify:CR=1 FL=1
MSSASASATPVVKKLPYPAVDVRPTTTTYFGTEVTAGYQWLEDSSNPAVQKLTEAQNALTRTVLDGLRGRPAIEARVREQVDAWTAQIEDSVAEAAESHDDAPSVADWHAAVDALLDATDPAMILESRIIDRLEAAKVRVADAPGARAPNDCAAPGLLIGTVPGSVPTRLAKVTVPVF